MSTLSQMRSRIADDLDRSDLSTQIDKAINRAIKYYESYNFWFKETVGTFTTTPSKKSYSASDGIPSDIAQIHYMEVKIDDRDRRINPRTYAYIEDVDPSLYEGYPSSYAWYQEEILLYPVPDETYTVTVSYVKTYSELSTDTDSNDFTTDAEDLIESRATWWVNSRVIKDYEAASVAKAEESEALAALRTKTEKLVMSKRIRPVEF